MLLLAISQIGRGSQIPRPLSPWRQGAKIAFAFALLNLGETVHGFLRLRFYANLFFIAVVAFVLVGTRLWPDKIRFRRRGEVREGAPVGVRPTTG